MKKSAFFAGTITICMVVLMSCLGGSIAFAQKHITYQPQSTFLSPEKVAPMPFTGLAVKWHEEIPENTSADIFVRFQNEKEWSSWNELDGDHDEKHEGENDQDTPTAFISTDKATAYQYKIDLASRNPKQTPLIENIEFTYIHAHEKPSKEPERIETTLLETTAEILASKSSTSNKHFRIISRREWGADESLRLFKEDNPPEQLVKHEEGYYEKYANELELSKKVAQNTKGDKLTWPLEYPNKVSKIVIHHTATTKNLNNPKQAIRDIYYFHSISRGWGDIGYNYIIDQKGNIYEGRYGGDGVIGAHAGRANNGSVGIAVLGNYDKKEVPEPVISSLVAIIKSKAARYGIDTMGRSKFRGTSSYNIMGHRDVMSTTCPGDKFYAQLPTIRALAKNEFKASIIDKRRKKDNSYNFDLSGNEDLLEIEGGGKTSLLITLKNTGTKSWDGSTYVAISKTRAAEKHLAPAKDVRRSAKIGKTLKPGNKATFSIPIHASHEGGFTTLEIFPMVNGSQKLERYASIPVKIKGVNYDYELVELDMSGGGNSYKRGAKVDIEITMLNTGETIWKRSGKNKIMLGTENPRDHLSRLLVKPGTRFAGLVEREVQPGDKGHFRFEIKIPSREGYYREYFAPVIEGITWLPHNDNYIEFYVSDQSFSAKFAGTNHSETFSPGEKRTIWLEFENTGRSSWTKDDFKLSVVKNSSLRVSEAVLEEDEVLPGAIGRVQMDVYAPQKEGTFRMIITPKIGGKKLSMRAVPMFVRVDKSTEGRPLIVASTSSGLPTTDNGNIKIGLSFKGNPVISAGGSFVLYNGKRALKTFGKNEKVTVTYERDKFYVRGNKAVYAIDRPPRFEPADNAILRIDNYDHRPGWNQDLNDNEYRGALEVHIYENALHVVNDLNMEAYLKGLAEIDAKQNFEKIKAVIVLARSYAEFYTEQGEKFPGAPFHLSDDPQRSQFYLGYGFEKRNPTGVKAVNATSGEVVKYLGNVIKTPYFSASDGRTRSAEEVWGWTNAPYLQSVDDPGCKGEELRGHGVGLSGCGAQYWAEKGKNYKDIIKYYFQGVEISP